MKKSSEILKFKASKMNAKNIFAKVAPKSVKTIVKKLAKPELNAQTRSHESLPEMETLSDESYLRMAYKVIFEREIDSEGLANWLNALDKGLSRTALVRMLVDSIEFQLRPLSKKDYWHLLNAKLHHARFKLIRTVLPEAKVILDLGGASTGDARGALLSFGYPYLPEKIYIADLPPDERMLNASELTQHIKYKSCDINYVYTSMSDLSSFEEGSFDLVWSGQSIEHVTQEDAEKVFAQAYKLLKPGGKLALDTPNRSATQIQCPKGYIHPEHKIEYFYSDLCQILERHNFKIVETKGLIDLSKTIDKNLDMKHFCEEAISGEALNDRPEKSYCFYMCCMRSCDI
ncbi:MAG: hypothetical protein CLLPBCKN_005094 [Chroococcidiopsis cubana SAG 39.79]|uniref:Methyltransferase type 11 domain-containing protein n=2 Tax=Chroococcidiopsidaceae TaxID=1890528 RepID=A0AB37USV0_9CYAN|nr:methyltransferase domain-containing protein [Chroococcidiopsis cubana]MDZ4875674.1 hypothetical protein [Chroococcidiopsis cubana SAG 39.79]PSB62218.1 hypothetical protein C7B79_18955 [Chroococcidiopsis cubana CCALA 043]RUT14354.1 hypothetical protein DSM107010_03850 [Chroococcidiopsis cubana SAG 39.79]